ncbi:MAG: phospholipase D-like domain-containing protein [Candidatus Moranbacteria bacterium]|nr:phospholipase D-like domain-containing protein [Candidatus Moranbacteria bacterium]
MNGTHTWKFFTTSEMAWEGMLESCRKAQETIDLEQYIFSGSDIIGRAFVDLLLAKAKEGVVVRLLLDAAGSFGFYRGGLCRELKAGGIRVAFHQGIVAPAVKKLFPLALRDHRKLLVVDKTEAHIGGVIIAERARLWRDTAVSLRGEVVGELARSFETVWQRSRKMGPVGRVLSKNEDSEFSIAGNSFHLYDKHLYRSFLRHITAAKKYIYITSAYFSPNGEFRRALVYAHKKGVDVRILLPKKSDILLADLLATLYFKRLLRQGIRIFLYTPKVLHAKSIVIDDAWASVGSCNFDWLSFWINYELNVMSTNTSFASELRDLFLLDLKESEEMFL